MGEVAAETSAGHRRFVDGEPGFTVRNLTARLFFNRPDVGGRLIRLGCLFTEESRRDFLGERFPGTGLPPGDGRSPAQAKADRAVYEAAVHLANFCAAYRLDQACTRAVVKQVVHLAERGNDALVHTTLSSIRNDWQKHTVSATHGGLKKTMRTYGGSIERFCAWGADNVATKTELLPLSRHVVVSFLEADASRRMPGRRRRGRAGAANAVGGGDASSMDEGGGSSAAESPNDSAEDLDGGASGVHARPRKRRRTGGGAGPPAPARSRGGRATPRSTGRTTAAARPPRAGSPLPAAGGGAPRPRPLAAGADAGMQITRGGPHTAATAAATAGPAAPPSAVGAAPRACIATPSAAAGAAGAPAAGSARSPPGVAAPGAARPAGGGPSTGTTRRVGHQPAAARSAGSRAAADAPPAGRLVGHHVLQGHLNALAKVANQYNPLWRSATCACCAAWGVDEYLSAGSFHAALSVVGRRKRERMLQESAAGTAKALGKRDPSLSDDQRRSVSQGLLLQPTTAMALHRHSLLNALWIVQFSLDARGATVRDLAWSDLAARTFPGMFGGGGGAAPGPDVLCAYISATKTSEGVVRCVGALPHEDPWLCALGAAADAMAAFCHRPGADATRPPVQFEPSFRPDDKQLLAAGVRPAHFREAGEPTGFRLWYRCLVVPGPNGGTQKPISYRYHNENLKKVMMAAGVPDWAAKTHLCRRAAAQAGKERGAAESDLLDHGIWQVGPGGGVYEAPIPNRAMLLSLSGRDLDCRTPVTPRMEVVVPEQLQKTFCPWLEDAEAALSARVSADARATDQALLDFFGLVRLFRSVFFQSWAARLATASIPPSAYVLHHPLLRGPLFAAYRTTMARALAATTDTAAGAVRQVLPQLADAVRCAVEAVATATAVRAGELERDLSLRMDEGVASLQQRTSAGFQQVVETSAAGVAEVKAHVDARFAELARSVSEELGRSRELMARLLTDDVVRDPRARALIMEELRRGPPATGAGPAVGQVLRGASTVVAPAATVSPAVRVSQQLVADRDRVRTLQSKGLLAGVAVHESVDECVPLLPMQAGLGWEQALDEYAVGVDGRVGIWTLQQHFGGRWRLRQQGAAKKRVVKLFSERGALYRAFDAEYARRGQALGVEGVVSFLKQKYAQGGNTKAVLAALKRDYHAKRE